MDIVKKHVLIAVGAAAIAVVSAVGIYSAAVGSTRGTEVVVAKAKIDQGQKITSGEVAVVTRSAKDVPLGAQKNLSVIVGEYAQATIYPSDVITSEKVSAKADEVPDGKFEVSVPVKSFAAGLSGSLQPGDIVSICGIPSNGGQTVDAPNTLQYVKIVSVYPTAGQKSSSGASTSNTSVTLLVTQEQFKVLASWDNATLHFALVSRGDDKKAQALLQQQDQILNASSSASAASSESSSSDQSAASTVTQ